jgi:hypothetical protein
MRQNVGTTDRALRGLVTIGAVVGSAVLGFSSAWGIVLLVVAAVMAATAASGYCPLYRPFGITTNGTGQPSGSENGANRRDLLHREA